MNPALAFKIEQALGLEEGDFMVLQAFYDMKQEKLRQHSSNGAPDLTKLRSGLFWDTDINTIDWQGQKRAVLERVIERG